MKLLFLLLLLPCCVGAQQLTIADTGWVFSPGTTTSLDDKHKTIDSFSGSHFWIYNYKKVPEKGLYSDTSIWLDKLFRLYEICVFYDQHLVVNIKYTLPKGNTNRLDVWIDDKIMPKK